MRRKNSSKNSIVVTLGFEDTLWQTSDKIGHVVERAWLYIVTFCEAQRPKSRVIGNPLAKLTPKKLRQQVQSSKVKKAKRSQKKAWKTWQSFLSEWVKCYASATKQAFCWQMHQSKRTGDELDLTNVRRSLY